ncbi:MAG TPA: hypothetical protein VKC59_06815 [Candidatus Limnocylindrales bacterium]|nr:hypothetical protein [Candidatus Limnocylindrales bacterium]
MVRRRPDHRDPARRPENVPDAGVIEDGDLEAALVEVEELPDPTPIRLEVGGQVRASFA